MRAHADAISDRLIITAASAAFGPSLLSLLGALTLNWPHHPPVRVYDIGLDRDTLALLQQHDVDVVRVPPFCPHWRLHFTWKLWCLADAPAQNTLWIDAGAVVLQPLDEIFECLNRQGYFVSTNYELLDWEASDDACHGCGVSPEFRRGKLTLPATMIGFRKSGTGLRVLEEALAVALVEKHIAATDIAHRHDQAILSLLIYKYLSHVVVADGTVYLASLSPRQIPGQKVWVHRGKLLSSDATHLVAHIRTAGPPYMPTPPFSLPRARALSYLYRTHWCFGRRDLTSAREAVDNVLRADPLLMEEPTLLAGKLRMYQHRLDEIDDEVTFGDDYLHWMLRTFAELHGRRTARQVARCLAATR